MQRGCRYGGRRRVPPERVLSTTSPYPDRSRERRVGAFGLDQHVGRELDGVAALQATDWAL